MANRFPPCLFPLPISSPLRSLLSPLILSHPGTDVHLLKVAHDGIGQRHMRKEEAATHGGGCVDLLHCAMHEEGGGSGPCNMPRNCRDGHRFKNQARRWPKLLHSHEKVTDLRLGFAMPIWSSFSCFFLLSFPCLWIFPLLLFSCAYIQNANESAPKFYCFHRFAGFPIRAHTFPKFSLRWVRSNINLLHGAVWTVEDEAVLPGRWSGGRKASAQLLSQNQCRPSILLCADLAAYFVDDRMHSLFLISLRLFTLLAFLHKF